MAEINEPPFIKYEEILLPGDPEDIEKDPQEGEDEDSSDDEDVEMSVDEGADFTNLTEQERAQVIRNETIGTILDSVFTPRKIKKRNKSYLLRLSRQEASREDVIELSKAFEDCLKERQVRMNGYCPIRRELYDALFDELIRQSTVSCAERGSLLLRIRDEFRMTVGAHEALYASGVEFGSRKALEAELEQRRIKMQHAQLVEEVARSEKRLQNLRAQIESEKQLSQQRIDESQTSHEDRMRFLRNLNRQLKEQLSFIN